MKHSTLILAILMFVSLLHGQSDNILWAGIKLQKPINEKWGVAVLPYMRLNENLGSYENTSIDYSVRYNLSKEWQLQLLGRTWFIPEDPGRQFVWFDVAHKKSYSGTNLVWTNRIRWHLGLDLHSREDTDFLRYLSQLRLKNPGKLHPFIGFEMWYQIQGRNDFTRMRIEPGLTYDLSTRSNFTLIWRRQNFINIEVPRGDNLWVAILSFDL